MALGEPYRKMLNTMCPAAEFSSQDYQCYTDVYIAMSAWKLGFSGNAYMITTTAHPV